MRKSNTITKMNKGFNQVVEIEVLDDLIVDSDLFLVIILLLPFVQALNNDQLYNNYNFEIIEYGIAGKYPAIGIQYPSGLNYYEVFIEIEKDLNVRFLKYVSSMNVWDFIGFLKINSEELNVLLNKFGYKNFIERS